MKKIINLALALFLVVGLTSCFEELDKTFDEMTLVEFQQAITLTPATGRTYPIVNAGNGTAAVTLRPQINLVGPQRTAQTTVKVSVDRENSTAVEGTHFTLGNGGNVVFAPNTSTANVEISVRQATGTPAQTVTLVLILEPAGDVKPSENYKRLGYTIRI